MTARDYKFNARMALRGFYMPFVLARLLFYLFSLLLTTISGNVYTSGLMGGLGGYGSISTAIVSGSVIFGLAMDLLVMVLGWIFAFGYMRMGLRRNRGEIIDISMVFDGFRPGQRPWKLVGASALISLISFAVMFVPVIMLIVGSFVTIISGIPSGLMYTGLTIIVFMGFITAFINLSFAMAPFIILDHQEIGIIEALRLSYRMMRGKRLKLLWLVVFSFFGWHVLNLFTLGILSMWLEPYILSSVIQFYMDLNNEYPESHQFNGNSYNYNRYNGASQPNPYNEDQENNKTVDNRQLPDVVSTSYDDSDISKDTKSKEIYEDDGIEKYGIGQKIIQQEEVTDQEVNNYKNKDRQQPTILNGEPVKTSSETAIDVCKQDEEIKSKSFEELMEELYKENKLKNDNYFGKGDRE